MTQSPQDPSPSPDLPRRRDLHGRRPASRWPKAVVGALCLALLAAGGISVSAALRLRANIETTTVSGLSKPAEDQQPVTILLIGSDGREDDDGELSGGKRSDSMVLVHIDEDRSWISGLQIPRDTMITAPGCPADNAGGPGFPGGLIQINGLLGYGPGCLVAAVEDLSGVPINHYVEIGFAGFADVVDALGGVDVCLPEALRDPKAQLDLPAGEQRLAGRDALALARTRHAVGDGSDLARMGHQQMVMSAIVQQVKRDGVLSRPARLYAFLDAVTSSLTVDEGLGRISTMAALGQQIADIPLEDVVFMSMPVEEYAPDPNRVQPGAEAETVFERMRNDERIDGGDTTETEDEATETPGIGDLQLSAVVDVRNGSGIEGAAAELLERLTHAGLITGTAENTEAAAESSISYPDGLEDEARALAAALGLDPGAVRYAPGGAFVVTIGQDFPSAPDQAAPDETGSPETPAGATADTRTADADLCA